jgi:hypothetical protein
VTGGRGLDIAEQSLRDVFNDVSKYIGNISISLNAVFPSLPDNPDRAHSPDHYHACITQPRVIRATVCISPQIPTPEDIVPIVLVTGHHSRNVLDNCAGRILVC